MSITYLMMLRRHCVLLTISVFLALLGGSKFVLAAAGQSTTASIIGQVTDESGGVLPGVTVSATSPALQVPVVSGVTDANGEYRLTPLPIGIYAVEYELSGFGTVRREEIRLTAGFVAKGDAVLKVGGRPETITVSGAAPVVDVTSTTVTHQMTQEALQAFPTTRNGFIGLLNQSPGVRSNLDVGGSGMNAGVSVRAYGQGGEPVYLLEGVYTPSPNSSSGGSNYFDYTMFEETQVQTMGADANMPTRGVLLNMIVKSGGNDFHGSTTWHQTNDRFQSNNIDAALAARGIRQGNEIQTRWDVAADVGGRIIRDKLWFYVGGRKRGEVQSIPGYVLPDGKPGGSDQRTDYWTGKLSYQMSKANRFVGFYTRSHKFDINVANQFVAWESRTHFHPWVHTGKVEWQTTPTNSLVANVLFGIWELNTGLFNSHSDKLATLDRATQQVTGEWTQARQGQPQGRKHLKADVAWYRPDLIGGNHQFKVGVDRWASNVAGSFIAESRFSPNYQLVFNNGSPLQLVTWNIPSHPREEGTYFSLYAQDSWTIGRRVTLNLGLRYAHDRGYVPPGCRPAADPPASELFPAACFDGIEFNTWNPITPRVRVAYDVTGDGKTGIKGGWGRFVHMRSIGAEETAPADPLGRVTATFRWRDLNGNRAYDPGEVNFDPNGPDFVSRVGAFTSVPNPNEREPYTDEFSITVDRELIANMAVRATGVYTRNSDIYRNLNILRPPEMYSNPVTRPDPGPDGLVGTVDDPGTSITYYEYPAAVAGARFEKFMLTNDPDVKQTFKTIEFLLNKRLSNRWMATSSYSATKLNNPLVKGLNPSESSPPIYAADADPNAEIFAADRSWEWLFRTQAAYYFPGEVMVSATVSHLSGTPWARQVLFTGGVLSSITVRAEPIGTRRLPHRNQVDLRVEKTIRLTGRQRLELRANLYNLLNSNAVLRQVELSGARFMTPTAIMPPRILEFGVAFSF